MNEVDFYGCAAFRLFAEGSHFIGLGVAIDQCWETPARGRFEYSSAEWRTVECLAVSLTAPDVTSEKSSIAAKKAIPKMRGPATTVF